MGHVDGVGVGEILPLLSYPIVRRSIFCLRWCPTRLAGPAQHQGRRVPISAGSVGFLVRIITALVSGSHFWRKQRTSCGGDRRSTEAVCRAQVSACARHLSANWILHELLPCPSL